MDPFIYRECRATITARIPDTVDADQHPDRVLVQGRGTAHPQFQGGSVVFPEIGEYAIPQPIPVVIVDGELLVEVLSGDETISTQPLFLPVTVDERANQYWSWRLTFDFLTLGEYGEEVAHPPLSFPVEAGGGPLEISTVATPVIKTSSFVTRGAPGAGLQEITAENGELVFQWDNGRTASVPVPDAVEGPPGPMVDVTAGTVEVGATPTDFGVSVTGEGEVRQINVMLPKPEKGDKGDKGDDGPAPDLHEFDEYVSQRVYEDVTVRDVSINRIPNPLMPSAGTVEGWGLGSPTTNPEPTWQNSRLHWAPNSTGSSIFSSPVSVGSAGEEITVRALVNSPSGTVVRARLHHGTSVGAGSVFASADSTTAAGEQELTVSGVLPAGQSQWRISFVTATQNGWMQIGSVTTASTAFDGDTISDDPLSAYSWAGEPYQSDSVHRRGALNTAVLSDVVSRVEVVPEIPASNPDMVGTLYIAPAFRPPIFTDFDRGLEEITSRWVEAAPWQAGDSYVSKPQVEGFNDRGGFSLNVANQAENVEVLTLSWIESASTGNLFGPVVRGSGQEGVYGAARGITFMLAGLADGVAVRIQEYTDSGPVNRASTMVGATGSEVGAKFWQRLRVSGDMAFGKIWREGDTEPTDWTVAGQISIHGQGWVGWRSSVAPATYCGRMGVSFTEEKAPGAF